LRFKAELNHGVKMSSELKDIKSRFIDTILSVSDITGISIEDITREDFIRISVDTGLEGRLNKEELNLMGGFSFLKETLFEVKKIKKEQKEVEAQKEKDRVYSFILETFIELSQETGFLPTVKRLAEEGISKKMISDHFDSYKGLYKNAEEEFGDSLSNFITEHSFSLERRDSTKNAVKKHSRFIVTTAVSGKPVDSDFLKSLENYAARNKAAIMILPCQDVSKRNKEFQWELHPSLADHNIVFEDLYLNDKIHLSSILVSAKQINPLTGLDRMAQRKGSMVLASPKQGLKFVANSNKKLPKALMTTGAVTVPDYFEDYYMSKRTSYLAEFDHVMGAIVIEIVDDKLYHFRQLQSGDDGEIIDLGTQYNSDGSTNDVECIAVFGDTHIGAHDKLVNNELVKLSKLTRVREIVFHDIFDGRFNNHHDEGKVITKAKIAEKGQNSLQKEGELVADFLNKWSEISPKLTIVKSNHDEVLDRFLNSPRFVFDALNLRLSCELVLEMLDDKDPLKCLIEDKITLKNPERVNWLERDEDYKVYKSELSSHGDLGANGSRGSLMSLEKSYNNAIVGHSHTAGILRGVKQVGTSSLLKLGYNRGPSSWTQTACLEYPNGSFQLVNFIKKDGKVIWRL
jgi:hypothetical protein